MRDPKLTFLIRCAYGAVWLALIWLMVRYVLVWLLPFLIALALAALLEPAVVLCRRRLHLRRGFTATVLSLVVLGTVAAGLVLLAMVLLRQVCELSGRLPGYLEALPRWTELVRGRAQQLCAACPEGLRSWLEALLDGLSAQLAELLESMGQRCLRAVTAAAAALPQAVLFCATTLLAVLFTAGSYPPYPGVPPAAAAGGPGCGRPGASRRTCWPPWESGARPSASCWGSPSVNC